MKFNSKNVNQRRRALLSGIMALAFAMPAAHATSSWSPSQPILMVVPFPPGGGSDTLVRSIAPMLSERLGQSVVVENKSGASGAIGSDFVYRAAPDGYTMLIASMDAQSMAPHLHNVNFDATKFTLVGGIASMGYALMGRKDLPADTLPELIELLKKEDLTYASGGAGSSLHILTELFIKETGTDMLHVPFKGAGPGTLALLGGQVDLMMVPIAAAPQYRDQLKIYGITPDKRVDSLSDVPTLSEQGVDVVGASWMGVVAPPGTPDSVANTVYEAIAEVVRMPKVQENLLGMGMTPILMSRSEFQDFYIAEYRKWGGVVKDANITLD